MNQDFTVPKKSKICLKKNSCRGQFHLKKNFCTSSERKKSLCKLKIPHPPPLPPITFLMVPNVE